jgi:hypothetical protein
MRKYIFLISAFIIPLNLSAQKTLILPDVKKPPQIAVDGNDLYVFDEADYSLHIYTISPFALIQPQSGILRYDLFIVDQEKLYEIIKNNATGTWELLITDLEKIG